jgi:hypothetical protein
MYSLWAWVLIGIALVSFLFINLVRALTILLYPKQANRGLGATANQRLAAWVLVVMLLECCVAVVLYFCFR